MSARHSRGGGAEQPAGEQVDKLNREREDDRGEAWNREQVLSLSSASREMRCVCFRRWMHTETQCWLMQRRNRFSYLFRVF